jgi:hypothetical protein
MITDSVFCLKNPRPSFSITVMEYACTHAYPTRAWGATPGLRELAFFYISHMTSPAKHDCAQAVVQFDGINEEER